MVIINIACGRCKIFYLTPFLNSKAIKLTSERISYGSQNYYNLIKSVYAPPACNEPHLLVLLRN